MQAVTQGLKASLQVTPSSLLVSAFLALVQEVAKGEQESELKIGSQQLEF